MLLSHMKALELKFAIRTADVVNAARFRAASGKDDDTMELQQSADSVQLRIEGPVRLGEAATLQELCIQALEQGQNVVVDLSTAEHLHAAGLQVLRALELRLSSAGRTFAVVNANQTAATSISLCGLGRWLSPEKEQE